MIDAPRSDAPPVGAGFLLLTVWLVVTAFTRPTLSASFSSLTLADRQPSVVFAAATALIVALSAAVWGIRNADVGARRDVSMILCGAVVGLYLCVPETDLLRLLVLPTVLAGALIWFAKLAPFGLVTTAAIAGLLAWVTVADASFRGSSWVAAAACVSAMALAPIAFGFGETRPPVRLGVYAIAIVCWSRLAGGQASVLAATAGAVLILAAVIGALWITPTIGSQR